MHLLNEGKGRILMHKLHSLQSSTRLQIGEIDWHSLHTNSHC